MKQLLNQDFTSLILVLQEANTHLHFCMFSQQHRKECKNLNSKYVVAGSSLVLVREVEGYHSDLIILK